MNSVTGYKNDIKLAFPDSIMTTAPCGPGASWSWARVKAGGARTLLSDLRCGIRPPECIDHFEELRGQEQADGSDDVLRQVAMERLGDGARDGGERVGVAAERGGKADGLTLLQDVIL